MMRTKIAIFAALFLVVLLQACGDELQGKRHELCTYTPDKQKFDPAAHIDGRIAVIYKGSNFDAKTENGCDVDGYAGGSRVEAIYFPEEMYARSTDSIDMLVVLELKKGNFLSTANYQRTNSVNWTVDVYSGQLAISLIDYKTSTIIRNSVHEFTKIPEKIPFDDVKFGKSDGSTHNEYVVEPTIPEIKKVLREFSDKVNTD